MDGRLPDGGTAENKDNAVFIVTACNEHYENKALIAELMAALEYAKPFVKKWCHTQGNNEKFHAETIKPIDAALRKAGAG